MWWRPLCTRVIQPILLLQLDFWLKNWRKRYLTRTAGSWGHTFNLSHLGWVWGLYLKHYVSFMSLSWWWNKTTESIVFGCFWSMLRFLGWIVCFSLTIWEIRCQCQPTCFWWMFLLYMRLWNVKDPRILGRNLFFKPTFQKLHFEHCP